MGKFKNQYFSLSHSSRIDTRRVITLYWLGGDGQTGDTLGQLGVKAGAVERAVSGGGGVGLVARLFKMPACHDKVVVT